MPRPAWASYPFSFSKMGVDTRQPVFSPTAEGFADSLNVYFTLRASLKTRPGTVYLTSDFPSTLQADGAFDLWLSNNQHFLISVQNGVLYSYDFATSAWTPLSATVPTGLTLTFSSAAGTLPAGTYSYWVTMTNQQGETTAYGPVAITTTATGEVSAAITANLPTGQYGFNLYRSSAGTLATAYLAVSETVQNTPSATLVDTGSSSPIIAPTTNTAQLTPGKPVNFALLENVLVFGNGYDHNWGLDMTQGFVYNQLFDLNQQFPPCQYFVTHQEKIYASGNKSFPGQTPLPSRVFWCAADNPRDWTTSGDAGFVDVEKGVGGVVGLGTYEENVWIFKGDAYLGIYQLSGTTYNTYVLLPMFKFLTGFHRTILPIGNDLLFQGLDGIYSLKRLISFAGEINQSRISNPIWENYSTLPLSSMASGCGVWYEPENIAVFFVDSTGGGFLDKAYVLSPPLDTEFFVGQGVYKWSTWELPPCSYAFLYSSTAEGTFSIALCGTDTGTGDAALLQTSQTDTDANGTVFPAYIDTQFLYLGQPVTSKLVRNLLTTFYSLGDVLFQLTDYEGNVAFSTASGQDNSLIWTNGSSVNWTNGSSINWGTIQALTSNVPLVGNSRAFQVKIGKLQNGFELYAASLFYQFGGIDLR